MKRLIATLCLLCGFSVMADPPEAHVVDFSGRTAPGLQVYQANQKTFRWTMRNGNEAISLAGRTPFMYWATGNTATSVVSATCTVVTSTNGVFDAVFSAANLNTNGVMIYGVGISSGAVTVARQGVIIITSDPYATGAGSITYTTTFNWDLLTITGTSPYMLKPTNTAVSAYVLTSDGTTTGSYWAASSGSGSDTNTAINIATNKAVTESTRLGNLEYLTDETDPLWDIWRTNSAAGSTNCILPDGSLVDVKALFGGVGTETDPVAATNNVKRSDTNGWVVSAHAAWLTTESDPAALVNATAGWLVPNGGGFSGSVVFHGAVDAGTSFDTGYFSGDGGSLTNLALNGFAGDLTVATNAGTAGAGYYAMSNGVWTSFTVGAGGDTSDTNEAINIATGRVETAGWFIRPDGTIPMTAPLYLSYTDTTNYISVLASNTLGYVYFRWNSNGTETVKYIDMHP